MLQHKDLKFNLANARLKQCTCFAFECILSLNGLACLPQIASIIINRIGWIDESHENPNVWKLLLYTTRTMLYFFMPRWFEKTWYVEDIKHICHVNEKRKETIERKISCIRDINQSCLNSRNTQWSHCRIVK